MGEVMVVCIQHKVSHVIAEWYSSRSVLLVGRVTIAEWNSSRSVLPVARVQFPTMADFSLADRTLPTRPEPVWQKMAQSPLNDTTQPVDSEEEGRTPTTGRRWLMEKRWNGYLWLRE